MIKLNLSEKTVLTAAHRVQYYSFLKNLHQRHKSKLLLKNQSLVHYRLRLLKVLQSKKLTLKKIMNLIMNFVMIKHQKRNQKNQKKSDKNLLHLIKHLLHPVTKKKRRKSHQTMKHTPKQKKTKDLTNQLRKVLREWLTQQNLSKRWKVPMRKAVVSILKMKDT